MKTLDEFEKFYNEKLLSNLKVVERKRQWTLLKLILGGSGCGLAAAIPLAIYSGSAVWLIIAIFPAFFFIFLSTEGFLRKYVIKDFDISFKSLVVGEIAKFLNSEISYSPTEFLPQSDFLSSCIFTAEPGVYKGSDLIQWRAGQVRIKFSKLYANFIGGKKFSLRPYFNGFLFICDFNKTFRYRTIIVPDIAEKLLGRLGQTLQEFNKGRGELVKLDDPEFEKKFAVYSTDQIEARYILSASLMRRIVDYSARTKGQLSLSFIDSKMYVAVGYAEDRLLLDPKVSRSLLNFDTIRKHFEYLTSVIGIVEDLNLNTRIWTKQ